MHAPADSSESRAGAHPFGWQPRGWSCVPLPGTGIWTAQADVCTKHVLQGSWSPEGKCAQGHPVGQGTAQARLSPQEPGVLGPLLLPSVGGGGWSTLWLGSRTFTSRLGDGLCSQVLAFPVPKGGLRQTDGLQMYQVPQVRSCYTGPRLA